MSIVSSMLEVEPTSLKRAAEDDTAAQPKEKRRLFGRSLQDTIELNAPFGATNDAQEDNCRQLQCSETTNACINPEKRLDNNHAGSSTNLDYNQRVSKLDHDSSQDSPYRGSQTCSGKRYNLCGRPKHAQQTYQQVIAERSVTATGKAARSFYGINVHDLIKEAEAIENTPRPTPQQRAEPMQTLAQPPTNGKRKKYAMWTEKYRARKFTDLVGDERTHRSVLKWLKGWDSIVFAGSTKASAKTKAFEDDDRTQRKILLLTGPPGLGKTTMAHVCARQAGYEVVEINASDERSRDVVKGRIRDCVGTENVRGSNKKVGENSVRKAGKPVCVVVDEVDGVTGGSGGSGDGGFMKALIDLVHLDQKNSQSLGTNTKVSQKGRKGDRFRLLRPLILICNDVYHPALRPLRSSNLAEIIHIRKPPLDKVIARLKDVFVKEGIQAENDAVRRLCEASWGVSSRRDDQESRAGGEGDIRGVLVTAEWAASKLRAATALDASPLRLSRHWLEKNIINDLTSGGGPRGAGRGSARETAERVFLANAGFARSTLANALANSKQTSGSADSVSEATRAHALALLRTAVDTTGEPDRVLSEVFTAYPTRSFQDDNFLSKPNAAVEWLHFHDMLSSRVYSTQDWELSPYLSSSILGFHHLFGSTSHSRAVANGLNSTQDSEEAVTVPFQGPRADFEAYEARKQNLNQLQSIQSSLSLPLARTFRSVEVLATDLLPQLNHMLAPSVNPVTVGGSGENRGTAIVRRDVEKRMVERGAQAMCAVGVSFERSRVEDDRGSYGGFVYRMEPSIDTLCAFETASKNAAGIAGNAPARYAVRQVLDQEHKKLLAQQSAQARQARFTAGATGTLPSASDSKFNVQSLPAALDKENVPPASFLGVQGKGRSVKRDFFGRVISTSADTQPGLGGGARKVSGGKARIWVSYHEGFSNAVKKPIGFKALLDSLS